MIRVLLQGRTGNHMFQYAVGRHLAIKHKTRLQLDLAMLGLYHGEQYMDRFRLHQLNLQADIIPPLKSVIEAGPHGRVAFKRDQWDAIYREEGFGFDEKVLSLPGRTLLSGYFQSEKYFREIRGRLKEEFRPRRVALRPDTRDMMERITTTPSVAVHVRRGDYLEKPRFNVCGPGYFKRAMTYIRERVADPRFYLFSDDIPWCRETFSGPDLIFCEVSQSRQEPLFDMWLMSLCRHNIIANSSFSWWGAWLNDHPDKIVVSPDTWFHDDDAAITDRVCDDWVLLPVE